MHTNELDRSGVATLLTVEEAAHLLGVGRTMIFQFLRDGRLRRVRFGRRTMIPRADVVRMIEDSLMEPVATGSA